MMPTAVEARDLTLSWGKRPVLRGVTLSIESGVVGMAGPNGAGKSTFLKACLGLVRPQGGTLRVFGEASGTRRFPRALRQVGWAPQQRAPGALRLTVRDLVSLFTTDAEAVEAALETAGIADLARRPTQELSGGQLQRANIARALATRPGLLLLDEPTTHLDAASRRSVVDLLERMAATGTPTLVVVSHDPQVLALCGRWFAFADGTVREADRQELDLAD